MQTETIPAETPNALTFSLLASAFEAIGLAIAADVASDPDGPTMTIRAAYREADRKLSGSQVYRRVRYPGKSEEEWPECDRLPSIDRARSCSVDCDVPIGTIVVDYDSTLYRGAKSKAKVTIGIVTGSYTKKIVWLEHRSLRSVAAYEIETPNRGKIRIARRES